MAVDCKYVSVHLIKGANIDTKHFITLDPHGRVSDDYNIAGCKETTENANECDAVVVAEYDGITLDIEGFADDDGVLLPVADYVYEFSGKKILDGKIYDDKYIEISDNLYLPDNYEIVNDEDYVYRSKMTLYTHDKDPETYTYDEFSKVADTHPILKVFDEDGPWYLATM